MAKRKGTPVEEIEEAAKRVKKHKESRSSARSSRIWHDFLLNEFGVHPEVLDSERGKAFWNKVRIAVKPVELEPSRLRAKGVIPEYNKLYRDVKGRFTANPTGEAIPIYRSAKTGRFVSVKNI